MQLVKVARQHFDKAGAIMAACSRRAVRAPRIMGEVYRLILEGMAARGFSGPRVPVKIFPAAARAHSGALRPHLMPRTIHIIGAGLAGLGDGRSPRRPRRRAHPLRGRRTEPAGAAVPMTTPRPDCASTTAPTSCCPATPPRSAFLDAIGARALVAGAPAPRFPFVDLASGEHWTLDFGAGRLPFWIFDSRRRAPGTRPLDYLALLRMLVPAHGKAPRPHHLLRRARLRAGGAAVPARRPQY